MSALNAWTPSRPQVAAAAVLVSVITGLTGALLGGSGGFVFGATGLVTLTLLAIPYPVALAGQVVAGSALAGALLLSGAVGPFQVLPLVVGVVATAELLGLAARLGATRSRAAGGELSRAGVAILVTGGAFSSVQLLGTLPGPSGLLAVVLASGACLALSLAFAGSRPGHSAEHSESNN